MPGIQQQLNKYLLAKEIILHNSKWNFDPKGVCHYLKAQNLKALEPERTQGLSTKNKIFPLSFLETLMGNGSVHQDQENIKRSVTTLSQPQPKHPYFVVVVVVVFYFRLRHNCLISILKKVLKPKNQNYRSGVNPQLQRKRVNPRK